MTERGAWVAQFEVLSTRFCIRFACWLARIPSSVISSPGPDHGACRFNLRAALLLVSGVWLIIATVWAVLMALDSEVNFWPFFWGEFVWILALVFAIPIVVWFALKLWLEGEPSDFPEIDRVLGSRDARRWPNSRSFPRRRRSSWWSDRASIESVNSFMSTASPVPFPVRVSERSGTDSRVCQSASDLHLLHRVVSARLVAGNAEGLDDRFPTSPIGASREAGPLTKRWTSARWDKGAPVQPPIPAAAANPTAYSDDVRSTLANMGAGQAVPNQVASADMRGTMMVGDPGGGDPATDAASRRWHRSRGNLSPTQASMATAKLAHICRLVRRLARAALAR